MSRGSKRGWKTVASWLSEGWIRDTRELGQAMAEREGMSAILQYVLEAEDGAEYPYYWVVEDGRLADAGLGEHPTPDVELAIGVADARAMQTGQLDATSAFMEGKLRVTGNLDRLLELLPLTASTEYQELERELARRTDFDSVPD